MFEIATVLIVAAALFAFVNHRYLRLPTTIGVMVIALGVSLVLLGLGRMGLGSIQAVAEDLLLAIDFDEALLHGMLGFLLFAGALHINLNDLASQKWVVAIQATVGVLFSTLLVAVLSYGAFRLVGIEIPLLYALLFGSLISPTDPVAVLGILKSAGAPKSLETKMAGESLFNDGVGVVVFLVLLSLAKGDHPATPGSVAILFAEEALGGIVLGLALGWVAYQLLKRVDHYQVEVLLTLALVMGGYALAGMVHTSGPIAVVVAGLLIGNHGRSFAMSDATRERLDDFWELVDEILNAVLFVLIGLEILIMPFARSYALAAVLAIPLVLLARWASVATVFTSLRWKRTFTPGAIHVLTWGGLRGGISVALALSLPAGPYRDPILAVTYGVVVFSIVVQGLTVAPLIRRVVRPEAEG